MQAHWHEPECMISLVYVVRMVKRPFGILVSLRKGSDYKSQDIMLVIGEITRSTVCSSCHQAIGRESLS